MTKVLLADDHALVRDGLRHILEGTSGFEVVGEAYDGPTTISLVRGTPADVLVLDLSMPGRNGIELVKQIKDELPTLRVLVLTMHAEQQYAVRAFKAGASGYLTKESASKELVSALTKISAGGVYVSLSMAERLAQSLNEPTDMLPHQRLSDREFDVFRGRADNQRNRQRIVRERQNRQHLQNTHPRKDADAARSRLGSLRHSAQVVRR